MQFFLTNPYYNKSTGCLKLKSTNVTTTLGQFMGSVSEYNVKIQGHILSSYIKKFKSVNNRFQ